MFAQARARMRTACVIAFSGASPGAEVRCPGVAVTRVAGEITMRVAKFHVRLRVSRFMPASIGYHIAGQEKPVAVGVAGEQLSRCVRKLLTRPAVGGQQSVGGHVIPQVPFCAMTAC